MGKWGEWRPARAGANGRGPMAGGRWENVSRETRSLMICSVVTEQIRSRVTGLI